MVPEARTFLAKSGEEFTFLFSHRALIAAEKAADAGLAKLLVGISEGRIGYILGLVQGGLSVHHPDLNVDDIWALWEQEGQRLVKAMAEALEAAMPIVKNVLGLRENPPQAAGKARGTGSRSSPRGAKKA